MPSPIGHSLIGIAAYAAATGCKWTPKRSSEIIGTLCFILLMANLPDLDLVFCFFMADPLLHRTFTHSILFCVLASVLMIPFRFGRRDCARFCGISFALLLSHVLSDMFVQDGFYPSNQMLLWPSLEYYSWSSFLPLFHPINWANDTAFFSGQTIVALGREVAIGLTLIIGVLACNIVADRHTNSALPDPDEQALDPDAL